MRQLSITAAPRSIARVSMGTGRLVALVGVALSLAACGKERPAADSSAVTAKAIPSTQAGGMGDMKGMPMGDTSGMKGMGMMGDMQKQMDAMMSSSPDQMKTMMPAHRQMAANMLADMTAEMRKMNTSGDAAWTAAMDSVRQDLIRMPDMNGKEMKDAMPAHHARMMRLMEMHARMSKNMKM